MDNDGLNLIRLQLFYVHIAFLYNKDSLLLSTLCLLCFLTYLIMPHCVNHMQRINFQVLLRLDTAADQTRLIRQCH